MFAARSATRTVFAHAVALSVFLGSTPSAQASVWTRASIHARAEPDASEIERLYIEGQQRADARDYKGAAESWTRLLNLLPESGDNQPVRESVILNVLDAHLKAYNQLVDENGNKDVSHLRAGKSTLDKYYADFKAIHGDRVAVSAAVQEKAEELEAALKRAEQDQRDREQDAAGTVPPPIVPDDGGGGAGGGGSGDPPVVVDRGGDSNAGLGLIIGGSIAGALGLGAVAMIPIGVIRVNQAEEDFQNADAILNSSSDPDERSTANVDKEKAEFDGNQGQAIAISGAVLAPLLLGGGAAMIVFGVRARKRARSASRGQIELVSPTFGPHHAGMSVTGRF